MDKLTIDSDSNALGKDVVICAKKGGNSTKPVELAIVVRETLGGFSLDKFKVKVVGLCNDSNSRSARITLEGAMLAEVNVQTKDLIAQLLLHQPSTIGALVQSLDKSLLRFTYHETIELSEAHLDGVEVADRITKTVDCLTLKYMAGK